MCVLHATVFRAVVGSGTQEWAEVSTGDSHTLVVRLETVCATSILETVAAGFLLVLLFCGPVGLSEVVGWLLPPRHQP